MAPMEVTARKATGKRIELGEKMRTTSYLEMLKEWCRTWASWVMCCLSWKKVIVLWVYGSINAGELEWVWRLRKRKSVMEVVGDCG
ncbi:hypothetical protein HanXRQr2_Chr11g0468201 [Helianthus annuus]|uniref:Uncharacterized protein n=1 Tax=Helianthus annuus TaxID=4232 RepID=A0A9K3HKP4_HELAN|nr:hypothetical protein HanXRQr2_Chr11g0468201 [Helianthus annuus]